MVAVNIVRRFFGNSGVQGESDPLLKFPEKSFRSPSVPEEQKLEASPLTVLAQHAGLAEHLGDSPNHRHYLLPLDECVQPHAQVRVGGQAAADAKRKTNLGPAVPRAGDSRQTYVIDFRIGAPRPAAGDADFELARQVVELRVVDQQPVRLAN